MGPAFTPCSGLFNPRVQSQSVVSPFIVRSFARPIAFVRSFAIPITFVRSFARPITCVRSFDRPIVFARLFARPITFVCLFSRPITFVRSFVIRSLDWQAETEVIDVGVGGVF